MAFPKLTDEPGGLALAAQIAAGALSPTEAVEAAIARIEQLDPPVNAVVVRDFERARDAAKALDGKAPGPDQPLFGVPITIKESYDVTGLPSTYGFPEFAGNIATSDARVVTQLKAAGAIIVGKTNVPINLSDWQSNNPLYGRTNNPHDLSRSPGGSSGGSAAALALGLVPIDFGGDIGGSLRAPAHFCGVWCHKPGWGLVSRRGHQHPGRQVMAHLNALSVHGPLARTAEDLAAIMQIVAMVPLPLRGKPFGQCRILALLDHPVSELDAGVRDPIEAAIAALRAEGITVDTACDILPDLEEQNRDFIRTLNISNSGGAPAPSGKQASAADWFHLLDKQAENEAAWERVFERYDFVLAPPAPILAPPHVEGELFKGTVEINGRAVPATHGLAWAGLATFPNLPVTVLPVGGTGGLPCGLQVIGPRWSDLDCIAAAGAIGEILHG